MTRKRTNDPSNLPSCVTLCVDPCRQRKITDELIRRLRYIEESFEIFAQLFGAPNSFNKSLDILSTTRERSEVIDLSRLPHPEIELLVRHIAKQSTFTNGDDSAPSSDDMAAAINEVLRTLKKRRGRPPEAVLLHHLTALMAALQEAAGKPVMVTRHRNSVYDPQASNVLADIAIRVARRWDPALPIATLVNAIEKIRRQYTGQPLRFSDLCPAYGKEVVFH